MEVLERLAELVEDTRASPTLLLDLARHGPFRRLAGVAAAVCIGSELYLCSSTSGPGTVSVFASRYNCYHLWSGNRAATGAKSPDMLRSAACGLAARARAP